MSPDSATVKLIEAGMALKGWDEASLAREAGVDRSSVAQLLRRPNYDGMRKVEGVRTLYRIAVALGIGWDVLARAQAEDRRAEYAEVIRLRESLLATGNSATERYVTSARDQPGLAFAATG